METIEELKRKIELLERFHPDDSTPEDHTPTSPNIKEKEEPEETQKELPSKDIEEEIEPVKRDEGDPIDPADEDEDEDEFKLMKKGWAKGKYIDELVAIKLEEEKEKLKLPNVIEIPTHKCECGVTLKQRYIECPVCGEKELTPKEMRAKEEAEKLRKEQKARKIQKQKDDYYRRSPLSCIIDEMLEDENEFDKIANIITK